MKVLLIDGMQGKIAGGTANLGLGFLASYIRKNHSVTIASLARHDNADIQRLVSENDVIGFSCITDQYPACIAQAEQIRANTDKPIIFGGVHPTAVPEEVLANDAVTAVCVGESEISFSKVLSTLEAGDVDLSVIPGVATRNDDGSIKTSAPEIIEDLDEIGMPAWDLLEYDRSANVRNVITSRACPYTCTYCYNSTLRNKFKHPYRRRSVESVVEECRLLKKEDINYLAFSDDLFLMDSEWLKHFAELYGREVATGFGCAARPEMVLKNRQSLELLKKAGLRSVWIGIESGSERVRSEIMGRRMSNEDIVAAFDIIHELGINSKSYNMVGVPTESIWEALETFRINLRAKPTGTSYYTMIAYPGTGIAKTAKDMDLIVDTPEQFTDEANIQGTSRILPGQLDTGRMNRYHITALRYLWEFIFFRHQRKRLKLRISFLVRAVGCFIRAMFTRTAGKRHQAEAAV